MLVTTHHKVALKLQAGQVVADPSRLLDMPNGDTAQFDSTDGSFRIVFKPWPFAEPANPSNDVTTNRTLTFQNKSAVDLLLFEFFCFITPTGTSLEVRYPGTSGGNGSVRP
jgi:hypothetical protein